MDHKHVLTLDRSDYDECCYIFNCSECKVYFWADKEDWRADGSMRLTRGGKAPTQKKITFEISKEQMERLAKEQEERNRSRAIKERYAQLGLSTGIDDDTWRDLLGIEAPRPSFWQRLKDRFALDETRNN